MPSLFQIPDNKDLVVFGPRYRYFFVFVFLILIVSTAYGIIQIWQTTNWMKGHSSYIHDRDGRWEQWIHKIDQQMDNQDRMFDSILVHVRRHETMMKENQAH